MQLIRANQKDTRNLSFAKTRNEDEKQDKTKSKEIVETTARNSSDQERN